MKNIKIIAIVLLATVLIISCDNKELADTNKPVIVLNSPAEGDTLHAGNEHGVHFDMELTDDVALSSYKVDIHNADDGHAHSKAEAHSEHVFTFNRVWTDVEGKKNAHIHHHEIVIPANAKHGKYHLMIYCTDEAGNESYVARTIYIGECNHDHDHDHDH